MALYADVNPDPKLLAGEELAIGLPFLSYCGVNNPAEPVIAPPNVESGDAVCVEDELIGTLYPRSKLDNVDKFVNGKFC